MTTKNEFPEAQESADEQLQTIAFKVRRGYCLPFPGAKGGIVRGPVTVHLNRDTARAYLHVADNYDEVRAFCGLPPTPIRRTAKAPTLDRALEIARQEVARLEAMTKSDKEATR